MKKLIVLVLSLVISFSAFSLCATSAAAVAVTPAASYTQEVKLEGDFSLSFKAMFRNFLNYFRENLGMKNSLQVTAVKMNDSKATIRVGDKYQLSATVEPSGSKNKTLHWQSEDSSIAIVGGNGLVTGKKAGQVKIYAIADDGGFYDYCTITVEKALEPSIKTADIKIAIYDDEMTLIREITKTVNANTYISYDLIKSYVKDYIQNSPTHANQYNLDTITFPNGQPVKEAEPGKVYRYSVSIARINIPDDEYGYVNAIMYLQGNNTPVYVSIAFPVGTKVNNKTIEKYMNENFGLDVMSDTIEETVVSGAEYNVNCYYLGDALACVTVWDEKTSYDYYLEFNEGELITDEIIGERLSEEYDIEVITDEINEVAKLGQVYFAISYL